MNYQSFIESKSQRGSLGGFEPIWMPDFLFDFQKALTEWDLRQGRSAIFADCGLGKTPMQLVWAENVVRKTNRPVLIVTPIAVGIQTVGEAEKFSIDAIRTRNGLVPSGARILITNYEQLHKYDPSLFGGVVCDESSAIKNFASERKAIVVEFLRTIQYRLLCTATAAPNDFWELGTSSEALGLLGFRDMITAFFKQEVSKDFRGWGRTKYRFRGHAEQPFWSWVCSWARALRKPSDLGNFDDSRFKLPELIENEIVVKVPTPRDGMLFSLPAMDMQEERAERRHSLTERCDMAASIACGHEGPTVLWCELNPEGDRLESLIPNSVQIKGSTPDEEKEEMLTAFSRGQVKRLITKPKIGAWGMNWQHCSNVVVFPSHSYEQYYQLVRRCYRFGQTMPVTVSIIVCEGERGIIQNLSRKFQQTQHMFESLTAHMRHALKLAHADNFPLKERKPSWLA